MMNCDLLNKRENEILQKVILKCISGLYAYTLEYKEGLKICAFIKMVFEGNISLIITTGSFADNIILMDESDFKTEKERYSVQNDVKMKANAINDVHELIGEKLLKVECVQKPNEEYYWQLNFNFQSRDLNVSSLVDELEISIRPSYP